MIIIKIKEIIKMKIKENKKIESTKSFDIVDSIAFYKFGDPYGNRTHDSALRGPRLNRLTKGPNF